jgi:polyisoprenyl-phosphate glycosyltransferase
VKLSVIIPCYNEAKNIPLILQRFKQVLDRDDLELIIVDNGSQDGSGEMLDRLLPEYPFARKVTVAVNQGYGYGILSGLRQAEGEYIGWTHADMQTDPYDSLRALKIAADKGYPANLFVKGTRKGRPLFDTFFTIGMSLFESCYLATPLWEINAQPNIFHRSFFDRWENPPHDFSLDLYAYYLAHKNGLNIERLAVEFPERLHGSSSWNTGFGAKWKFIKRTLEFSIRLKKGL